MRPMSAGTERTFDLAVIGGGPAGVTAALRAAELGARVALVERDQPGGTCTDDGCAPMRVLAKAARLARDAEQLADYGLTAPPPTLDFPALLAATQRTVYELHEKKQLAGHLERAGVRLVAGRGAARFTDPHRLVVEDGTELEADRYILAGGGHARRLPFPGSDLALTHNDVWTMDELPGSPRDRRRGRDRRPAGLDLRGLRHPRDAARAGSASDPGRGRRRLGGAGGGIRGKRNRGDHGDRRRRADRARRAGTARRVSARRRGSHRHGGRGPDGGRLAGQPGRASASKRPASRRTAAT